jgi:hypothetical protein
LPNIVDRRHGRRFAREESFRSRGQSPSQVTSDAMMMPIITALTARAAD